MVAKKNLPRTQGIKRVVTLPVEPLDHKSFEPFGQVIGEFEDKPAWQRPRLTSWRLKFSIDGTPDLKVIRYHFQKMEFDILERHISHTETRLPLGGGDFVMVVAAPTSPLNSPINPSTNQIRAFLVKANQGIMLWRGTWHSLDTYPVLPPHVDLGFISEVETQAEIEVEQDRPKTSNLTHVADYKPDGITFRVVDPKHLLKQD